MRKLLISTFVILCPHIALAEPEGAMEALFPKNSVHKCSPIIKAIQNIEKLSNLNVLAFVNCTKSKKQDDIIHLAIFEEKPPKLISKGSVEKFKSEDFSLHAIVLEPNDTKISDKNRVFQMRAQYKSKKDESIKEELIVLHDNGKEISAILRGPMEDYPGRGRAFLIVTKNKVDGYSDVAIKSEFKTQAFRWRGSEYAPFTREEIQQLKK